MMTGTRDRFDRELAHLQGRILEMGSLVHAAAARGLQALVEDNADLAREVIARDVELNRLRYDIENECYHLLVTEQPVAGDMRAIISGVIIASELERIADHGKKIARTYLRMLDDPRMVPLGDIPRLGRAGAWTWSIARCGRLRIATWRKPGPSASPTIRSMRCTSRRST